MKNSIPNQGSSGIIYNIFIGEGVKKLKPSCGATKFKSLKLYARKEKSDSTLIHLLQCHLPEINGTVTSSRSTIGRLKIKG